MRILARLGLLSFLATSSIIVASPALAGPCADLINIQISIVRPKLEGATLLLSKVESDLAVRQSALDDALKKAEAQLAIFNGLGAAKAEIDQKVAAQDALLKSVLRSIRKNKKKNRPIKNLLRKRNQLNKELMGLDQEAFAAGNNLFAARLNLLTLQGQASISAGELQQQQQLVLEAQALVDKYADEIAQLEANRAQCPAA